jgi:indole-3-glycerol phosphate synthase
MTILEKIAAYKREEVAAAKARRSLRELQSRIADAPRPRGFRAALQRRKAASDLRLIAEIKKASPSKGVIRADFDPVLLARAYQAGGATCLSVLTDTPSFQGSLNYLEAVREACDLPLLRKDFMLDPYQVFEAKAHGADCILIILAMVDDEVARALLNTADEIELDTLVEVHDEPEIDRALSLNAKMIGLNNRDLRTFQTDLNTTLRLAPRVPGDVLLVAESGLSTRADLEKLAEAGVTTFLIGESLMRQHDVAAATAALIGAKLQV